MQYGNITDVTVKMDTAGHECERYDFKFVNIKVHIVFTTLLLYWVSISLKKFTVINGLLCEIILLQRSLIKTVNKIDPKLQPCDTPDNARVEKENFPNMWTKEDLPR
jgi:hypothetical protein